MSNDCAEHLKITPIAWPPVQGKGSGREAWMAFALKLAEANVVWQETVERQSMAIRAIEYDRERLRAQIAKRKPIGSRERLPDQKLAAIERDIREGHSTRHIASIYGISAMTVSRIGKRMRSRSPS